jgi:hypothetical protein
MKGLDMKNKVFNSHPGLASNPNGGFDEFRQQLLLAMARRLAGKDGRFGIPASEIDDNGQYTMVVDINPVSRVFEFRVSKKQ